MGSARSWIASKRVAPLTTIGVVSAVLTDDLDAHRECVACETDTAHGEVRRWVRAFVLFGFVVHRYDGGANVYCEDCAADDVVLSEEVRAR